MTVPTDSCIRLAKSYRGRLAPTPTGDMHVGHARTFVAASRRAVDAGGEIVLRMEDLDPLRCRRLSSRALGSPGPKSEESPVLAVAMRRTPRTT